MATPIITWEKKLQNLLDMISMRDRVLALQLLGDWDNLRTDRRFTKESDKHYRKELNKLYEEYLIKLENMEEL